MPFFCEIEDCWRFWNKCDVEGYKIVCDKHIDKANEEISEIIAKEVAEWHALWDS
jgi:hypothetical protein